MNTLASKHPEVRPASRRRFLKGVCAASAASLCMGQPVLAAETPVVAIFATPDILARAQQALGKYLPWSMVWDTLRSRAGSRLSRSLVLALKGRWPCRQRSVHESFSAR